MRRFAVAVALAVALGGCGGGAEFAAPRIPAVTGNAQPGQNAKTLARVTIDWGHGRTSHSVRPRFISPSAQSLSVSVDGGPPQIADAPPHKNGQTTTLTIDAPAGTDLFEFDLWDRDGATGNLLGTARVTRSIVADQANVVNAVLDGVCAQIALAPAAGQPLLETSYRSSTGPTGTQGQPFYTFVGTSPETIGMTPLDADGNPILGTIPSIALAQAGTNLGGPAVVAISNAGNVATVKPTGEFPRGTTGALVANSPQCSSTVTVGFETSPAIYAQYEDTTQTETIAGLDRLGNVLAFAPTAFAPVAVGARIFADPVTGNVFVPESSTTLGAFTPAGSALTLPGGFVSSKKEPSAGAVDTSTGLIYVLYGGSANLADTIGVFDRNGNVAACGTSCLPSKPGELQLRYDDVHDNVCVLESGSTSLTSSIACTGPRGTITNQQPFLVNDFAVDDAEVAIGTSVLGAKPGPGLAVSANLPTLTFSTFSAQTSSAVAFDDDDGDLYSSESGSILAFDRSGAPLAPSLSVAPGIRYRTLAIVSPGPGAVLVVPSILAFTAAGQTQAVSVTDTSARSITEHDTCSGIARVAPGATAGQYEVTASAAGACVVTFTDSLGALTQVTVGVTITHLTGQSSRRGN
jgi:hypothetical protein